MMLWSGSWRKIHDNRFLRLIANMLRAGYLEDWQYHETLSGTGPRQDHPMFYVCNGK